MGFALMVMYSASGAMMERQAIRMVLSLGIMFVLAQISPRHYETWAPYLFGVGLLLLGGSVFREASRAPSAG